MMIKRLLSLQRIGLRLLILNLLIFPLILNSQEKGEGLELPKVVIYGKYFGKMQFSPKKDFYTYLNTGNLFPLARIISPEIRFPPHRKLPGDAQRITDYWVLLDAGAGNWWADKVFLDCGLRNPSGLLSVQLKDFRRKGWAEDHSENSNFLEIKGVLNQENYYISGNIFYDYEKITKGSNSPYDTVTTHGGGIDLLSRFDFDPVTLFLSGEFSMNNFLDRWFGVPIETPETIKENIYAASMGYNNPLEDLGIYATINVVGARRQGVSSGKDNSLTVTSADLLLKKTFNNLFTISSGVRMFFEEDEFSAAPLFSLNASIPGIRMYPFATYFRRDRINTMTDMDDRYPFVADPRNYTILREENASVGFEGILLKISYSFSYSHIEFKNYPHMSNPYQVSFTKAKKDEVKADINADLGNFSFNSTGNHTLHDKIPYEPVAEFELKTRYKVFYPTVLFVGLNGSLGIEKAGENVNLVLLSAGIEREVLNNLVLSFEVENILDQRYEIWEEYTEGGIQFFLSFKYKAVK